MSQCYKLHGDSINAPRVFLIIQWVFSSHHFSFACIHNVLCNTRSMAYRPTTFFSKESLLQTVVGLCAIDRVLQRQRLPTLSTQLTLFCYVSRTAMHSICRGTKDGYRQATTSAQCCRPCGQWHTEVWPRSDVTPPRWATLAGCTREGYLRWVSWCTAVFTVRHLGTSTTISSHPLHDVASRLHLRSANRHQLVVYLAVDSTHYGHPAFSIAGPTVWNSLHSSDIRRMVRQF